MRKKLKKIFRFSRKFQNKDEIILRDYLAMERTTLANERTLLSYLRSSLYLLIGGVALLKLEDFKNLHFVGYFALVLASVFVIVGFYRYQKLRNRLKVYYKEIDQMRQQKAAEQKERARETKPLVE